MQNKISKGDFSLCSLFCNSQEGSEIWFIQQRNLQKQLYMVPTGCETKAAVMFWWSEESCNSIFIPKNRLKKASGRSMIGKSAYVNRE